LPPLCLESDEPPLTTTAKQPTQPLVVIQRNPNSGSGRGRGELLLLARELKKRGYRVRMFSDRSRLDLYVRQIPETRSLKCIVGAGGDGTVTDLANRHPGVPVAVLPLGTENLLASYLGLTRCGRSLAAAIDRGRVRIFDSAQANGLRFLLMLSVGIDAEIVEAIHRKRSGNIYRHGYLWPILKAFCQSRPAVYVASSADGSRQISGSHIIVTNVPRYGFGLPFAADARPDDGLLDIRVFHGSSRWHIFFHALKLKLGLPLRNDEVSRFSTASVTIHAADSTRRMSSQCDGDPGPSLPILITIEPRSLTLIAPA